MNNTLFLMDYQNNKVGSVERIIHDNGKYTFKQILNGEETISESLPKILCGIAPDPTQLPHIPEVLEYYKMQKLDVWEYLIKSNGIHSGRPHWIMSEPVGEIWIPLIIGMQKYQNYGAWLKIGDKITALKGGRVKVGQHFMELTPECTLDYLPKDDPIHTSVTGFVYDVRESPSIRGLIGRIILNFPEKQER